MQWGKSCFWAFFVSVFAFGQEPSVEGLVLQLGANDYRDRNAAEYALWEMGDRAKPAIADAAAGSTDAEIKLRARGLLRRFKEAQTWEASRVKGWSESMPLSAFLKRFEQESGTKVLLDNQGATPPDSNVALPIGETHFWPAIDAVSREHGLSVRPHVDTRTPGLRIGVGALGRHPIAYNGAIRLLINRVWWLFKSEETFDETQGMERRLVMEAKAMWEDHFVPVAYQWKPRWVQYSTDRDETAEWKIPQSTSWNIVGSQNRLVAFEIPLPPPSLEARKLKKLKVQLEWVAAGDFSIFQTEDLSARSYSLEDMIFEVQSFKPKDQSHFEVHVAYERELPSFLETETLSREVEVHPLDQEGKSIACPGRKDKWSEKEERWQTVLDCWSESATAVRLWVKYAKLRSRRLVDFEFNDVALPPLK